MGETDGRGMGYGEHAPATRPAFWIWLRGIVRLAMLGGRMCCETGWMRKNWPGFIFVRVAADRWGATIG